MVKEGDKNDFESLKIENIEVLENGVNDRFVTLFFSFDIVNSTHYKTIALKDSLKIIKKIFDEIEKLVTENIKGIQYWRTIGDEIIFYLEIYNEQEILNSVEYIFSILNRVRKKILEGEIELEESQKQSQGQNRYSELISLKASAWLALVAEDDSKSLNIKYKTGYMTNDKRLEFQGHDIDVGFRVSDYTRNRRFALNFELAYLLSKNKACEENLKFIGYKKMKGVWNSRKYPVIWYHNNKLKELKCDENMNPNSYIIEKFEDSFFYDEEDFCDLTKEFNEVDSSLKPKNYINEKKEKINVLLERICSNINLVAKMKEITQEIQNKTDKKRNIVEGIKSEVHLVVICKENEEILMLKRKDENIFDFGHVKAEKNIKISSLKDFIEKKYLEKYGIEIEIEDSIYQTYFNNDFGKQIMELRFQGNIKKTKMEYSGKIVGKKINENNYKEYIYPDQKEFMEIIEQILKINR